MTRFEFIEGLKQALTGLPPEVITRTVAEYERRIFEASAAGQSEEEILAGLGNPQQIADNLRAEMAPKVPAVVMPAPVPPAAKGPVNFGRAFFSFIGLMLFNLFLVVPVTVYAALLFAAYVMSLGFFGGGIALTAGAVSGVNQIVLNEPFHHVRVQRSPGENGNGDHTVVKIGENGVHVETNADARLVSASSKIKDAMSEKAASATAGATSAASATSAAGASASSAASSAAKPAATEQKEHTVVDIGPNGVTIDSKDGAHSGEGSGKLFLHDHDGDDEDADDNVNIDMPGLHLHNGDFDSDESVLSLGTDFISASRPVQVGAGIGIILAGIIGFLLCLVVTRYSLLGLYRLAQMEFAVLRGA
ncbi:MAG TPA: DUF1700 domain-containing protein [Burkholderiaceae bacterium]|jgi:uncharacterized membrane protein